MLAGDDPKALEAAARYKEPTELMKAFLEQRGKLSQRAEPIEITDQSTPEEIAAYRKRGEVPEVSREAKDVAYAEAYGLKAPDGYEMTEVEKAYLGQFAKRMNSAHVPKRIVQKVVGEHFSMQVALKEQGEKLAVAKQREWQGKLRDELGSREYEARQTAAKAWLESQFRDTPEEMVNLLNAQLPGGGRLGDHPWMFNLVVDKAMGDGFTDRIEANSLESGGKSLAQQQEELEAARRKDRRAFSESGGEEKLKKIYGLRQGRGEMDEWGNEVRKRRA